MGEYRRLTVEEAEAVLEGRTKGKLLVMPNPTKYRRVTEETATKPRKRGQKRGQLIQWPVTESPVTKAPLRAGR